MRIFKLVLFFTFLFILSGFLFFENFENEQEKKLANSWKDKTYIELGDLLEKKFELACVIRPYGNIVIYDMNSYQVKKINNHLKKIDFILTEDEWALIVLNKIDLDILKFKRINVDIPTILKGNNIPTDFVPQICVDSTKGSLYLFKEKDRKYAILGTH